MADPASVAVIVAAKDAAGTIARAIRSALAEREVAQVIVVDDGSSDDTAAVAMREDDATGRLIVERLSRNRGPSAARNHALKRVAAPYFAILDSDDAILPGRFARLFAVPNWDMIGDNILFVAEGIDLDRLVPPPTPSRRRALDLAGFVDGCTDGRSRIRSQLGFLKPVIRTALLRDSGLLYDERVRLGEDFLLYAELLRRDARFVLTDALGYLAVERPGSLSARHGVDDLHALLIAERELATRLPAGSAGARAMARRLADTTRKHALRAFLAVRRAEGMGAAMRWLARRPADWRDVAVGIGRDKLDAARRRVMPGKVVVAAPRLLIGQESPGWN